MWGEGRFWQAIKASEISCRANHETYPWALQLMHILLATTRRAPRIYARTILGFPLSVSSIASGDKFSEECAVSNSLSLSPWIIDLVCLLKFQGFARDGCCLPPVSLTINEIHALGVSLFLVGWRIRTLHTVNYTS